MPKLIERIPAPAATLRIYIAVHSAPDRQRLGVYVDDHMREMYAIFDAAESPNAQDWNVWCCLRKFETPPRSHKYVMYPLYLLAENRADPTNRRVYAAQATYTVFHPKEPALSPTDEQDLRSWLFREIADRWHAAVTGPGGTLLTGILQKAVLWEYGKPADLWTYDKSGALVRTPSTLPFPEEHVCDGRAYLGIPLPDDDDDDDGSANPGA